MRISTRCYYLASIYFTVSSAIPTAFNLRSKRGILDDISKLWTETIVKVALPAHKNYIEPTYEEFIGPGLDEIAEAVIPVRKEVHKFMKKADIVMGVLTANTNPVESDSVQRRAETSVENISSMVPKTVPEQSTTSSSTSTFAPTDSTTLSSKTAATTESLENWETFLERLQTEEKNLERLRIEQADPGLNMVENPEPNIFSFEYSPKHSYEVLLME